MTSTPSWNSCRCASRHHADASAGRREAWRRLSVDLPGDKLDAMIEPAKLEDLGRLSKQILEGKVRGRVVVEIGA